MGLESSTAIQMGPPGSIVNVWDEGIVEDFDRLSSTAARILICKWADRYTLINWLQSGAILVGGVTIVTNGQPYPDAPWMYVSHVHTEGVDGDTGPFIGPNGMRAYKYCRLTVTYAPLEFNPIETGSLTVDFAAEVATVPRDTPAFKWSGSGSDLKRDEVPQLRIGTIAFTRTRKNLVSIPTSLIMAATDAPVNSASFLGAAAGRVKFLGAAAGRRVIVGGGENWDLTYKFMYRTVPWNYAYNAATGQFEAFVNKVTNQPYYDSSNLNLLLA
jgi:hypothetical protein